MAVRGEKPMAIDTIGDRQTDARLTALEMPVAPASPGARAFGRNDAQCSLSVRSTTKSCRATAGSAIGWFAIRS